MQAWGPPEAVAGTYELTIDCLEIARPTDGLSCSELLPDPWRFAFGLSAPTGTVVSDATALTVEGATLTLTELRVTPTMVAYRIALRVAGHDIVYWTTMDQTVRRGDVSFTTTDGYHVTQDPADQGPNGDENECSTSTGSDPAAGTWEIVIHEIWYLARGATEDVLLKGPWRFEVDIP